MIDEICDPYKAKSILDYKRGKTYAAAATDNKRQEARHRQR